MNTVLTHTAIKNTHKKWFSFTFHFLSKSPSPSEVCPSCGATPPTHWQYVPIRSRCLLPGVTGWRRRRSWTPARSHCYAVNRSWIASTSNQPPTTCEQTRFKFSFFFLSHKDKNLLACVHVCVRISICSSLNKVKKSTRFQLNNIQLYQKLLTNYWPVQ